MTRFFTFIGLFLVSVLANTAMAVNVVTTTPANGDHVTAGWQNKQIVLSFDQSVTIVKNNPDVKFTQTIGSSTTSLDPDMEWVATKDGDKVKIWGADYDSFLESYKAVDGAKYTFVIPAGVVKGTDGTTNEAITVTYTCGNPSATAPVMTTSTPANGSEISANKYANMKCVIVFDQNVSIVKRTPSCVLKQTLNGSTTIIEPDDSWAAGVDNGNQLTVWGEDYDGYTMYYEAKAGATYELSVPAGVVKSSDNIENEAFTVTWSVAMPKPLVVVSTVPAEGDKVEAKKYNSMAFDVVFDQTVTRLKRTPSVVLTETLNGTTTTVEPEDSWEASVTSKTLRVWGADYDGYTMEYETKAGASYKLVIPAGVVKTADGVENEQITINYSCGASHEIGDVITIAPYKFTVTAANEVEVTSVDAKDGSGVKYTSYTVPATVEGMNVTSIGEQAFKWSDATSISLPSTLKNIGKSAFASSKFTAIELPDGVETIGDYAFNSVPLTTFTCPSSLKKIGGSAFFTCKQLTSITFNEGLEEIGLSAFYHCEKLASVSIPSSIKNLGGKAFLSCTALSSVSLPEGLKAINDGTFNDCPQLSSITIPSTVEHIGEEAFFKCTSLTSVVLPASLKTMGVSVFAKSAVSNITVASGNEYFSVKDGVLYSMKYINDANEVLDKPYHLVYAVPMTGKSEVVVEDGCVGVNGGAFWGSAVSKVTLPESVIAFDDYAFCQSSLSDINLTDNILFIGEQAFASTMLTKIVIPSKVTFVNDGAFAGCTQLREVWLPAGMQIIYNHAFHNCTSITAFYALGETAPDIDDVWETYDSPFYGISETTPLYVPIGSADSYKAKGWNEYFTIVEKEVTAVESLTSGNQADNSPSYNLSGQRVSASHKGIVIKNGKAFIKK